MKKGLLTTSALVAAGMFGLSGHADAAGPSRPMNPVQLKVGGYMEQFVGVAFQRPKADTGIHASGTIDEQTEAEIHFNGQARLDNGLQLVVHVEYEVAGSPGNVVDDNYLILRNGFGQVILGNTDPVASLMVTGYATPFVTTAGGSLTYDVTPWIPFRRRASGSVFAGALQDSKMENWIDDANEIVYVSPRIGGLQVGVSYAPDSHQQVTGTGTPEVLRSLPNQFQTSVSDTIAAAANYTFAIDQFKVGIAGSFMRGNGTATYPNSKDPRAGSAGIRVDYGPYRVNFGYKSVWGLENGNAPGADARDGGGTGSSSQGHMWMAGAMYRFGPNAVSLDWQRGTERGIIGAAHSEVLKVINAAYSRHLAPGIRAAANLAWDNYSGQDAAVDSAPGSNGWAFVTSIRLDF